MESPTDGGSYEAQAAYWMARCNTAEQQLAALRAEMESEGKMRESAVDDLLRVMRRADRAEHERDDLRERVRLLTELLSNLILDDPWLVDRYGDGVMDCVFCETSHGHMEGCPHEEARAALAQPASPEPSEP